MSTYCIDAYSRADAIADGTLIDANVGDLAEVTRQHHRYPVAMTAAVFSLMEAAVSSRKGQDYRGIWHDILHMSRYAAHVRADTYVVFRVYIGRKLHTLKAVCGPGDDAEPVITVMLEDEA
jgi:hypothetical protein